MESFSYREFLVDLENPNKRTKYNPSDNGATDDNIHNGQLKLLLNEMLMLMLHWDREAVPAPVVVYAGSAPGYHIPVLLHYFDQIKELHCYDPRRTEIDAVPGKIFITQGYFTDEVARQFSGRSDVIFICDIRSTGPAEVTADVSKRFDNLKKIAKNKGNEEDFWTDLASTYNGGKFIPFKERSQYLRKLIKRISGEEHDQMVWDNMVEQERWVQLMRPEFAVLKFRLPWESPTIRSYQSGTLYFQAFTTQRGTETRLVIKKQEIGIKKDYDIRVYEDVCFHHNLHRSTRQFLNPASNKPEPIVIGELLNDWDSIALYMTMLLYFRFINQLHTDQLTIATHCWKLMPAIAMNSKHKQFLTLAQLREGSKTTRIGERNRMNRTTGYVSIDPSLIEDDNDE